MTMATRLVKKLTLMPWAMVCLQGALRRDAAAHRKLLDEPVGKDVSAIAQIAKDDERLSCLIMGIEDQDAESVDIIVRCK
jgi:hypothetical protein